MSASILVIEEDAAERVIVVQMLESLNYVVIGVGDVSSASGALSAVLSTW